MRALWMRTITASWAVALAAALAPSACKDDGDEACANDGLEGCPCADGGLCLGGLTCLSNFCVAAPGTSASDPPGTSASDPTATGGADPTGDEPTGGGEPCDSGLVRCDGACVDPDGHPEHCGGCGKACDPGEVCASGTCKVVGDCAKEGCPGFSYCDAATNQCLPGCDHNPQCGTGKHCDLETHTCVCPPGYHACGDACKLDTDITACGADCSVCPMKENAEIFCEAGQCGWECDLSSVECGGACFNVFSQPLCGSGKQTCTPCPYDPHGDNDCHPDTDECYMSCDNGYELCGQFQCKYAEGDSCFAEDHCCNAEGFSCINNKCTKV
ncbi:hypothetical protein [Nannocystis sp. SCPEA4]|uniref:hypothetical protein n=1 Tax=Nannocystis sp. SCPEA4 TaxID=2996787 RepID=UPI00226F6F62|nr:hypothetical protein [Nannocystis sp. SCPEA4]MCY1061507.1 hypothetical protein [Nannocystis sp. SCPEA4]